MSAGCGSTGREQSDPNTTSCRSGLNCQHLFLKATRCIVSVQRERGGAVWIQGQPSLRPRLQFSLSGIYIKQHYWLPALAALHQRTLCLVSVVCLLLDPIGRWLRQPAARPIDASPRGGIHRCRSCWLFAPRICQLCLWLFVDSSKTAKSEKSEKQPSHLVNLKV